MEEKQLQKLTKLLDVLDINVDAVSGQEFVDVVNQIINAISAIKRMIDEKMSEMESMHGGEMMKMKSKVDFIDTDTQKTLIELKDRLSKLSRDVSMLDIPSAKDILEEVRFLLEKESLTNTPGKIRDKLESLKGEERLDKSAIKGLDEFMREIRAIKTKGTTYVGGGTAAGGGRIVKSYDLSASLDGATKTFALPAFYRIISVHLSSFPNIMRPITDYTVDATAMTITFTSEITAASSLAAGQTLLVVYSEI